MNPLVTIAIPIYNASSYLADSILSCINQTFQDWELLLMEDGSTDDSLQIAQHFAHADARIKLITDGENKGLIYRLNQSVSLAQGLYYARMDADDVMVATRLEKQVDFLEYHAEVDVVGSSIMVIDGQNRIVGSGYARGKVETFFHPTIMGRTEWFRNHPYAFWAERAEDFELWMRTSGSSQFYAIESPLVFYREFGTPSFQKIYKTLRTLLTIFSKYREYHKSFSWFAMNSLMTYAKIAIYGCFDAVGNIDYVVKRRRRAIVPHDLCLTQDDLASSIQIKGEEWYSIINSMKV